MPRGRAKYRISAPTVDTNVTLTTETVVATLGGVSTAAPDERVALKGEVAILLGAAGVSFTMRIRRGVDTTGAVVGEATDFTLGAGSRGGAVLEFIDSPGEVASQSYVLTIAPISATGNSTVSNAALSALVPV